MIAQKVQTKYPNRIFRVCTRAKLASDTKYERFRTRDIVATMRRRLLREGASWDDLWKDDITPWELIRPTPVLAAEISDNWGKIASAETSSRIVRALIPVCGSGHDLVTLARHCISNTSDAVIVGLDVSSESLERAKTNILQDGTIHRSRSCRVELAVGDFFDSKWDVRHSFGNEELPLSNSGLVRYDFIFDHVFFCALPPKLRPAWGSRMKRLLTPGSGRLLTLMYPIVTDDPLQGPPFPVSVADYRQVLQPHGFELETEPYESQHTVESRRGMELVGWWKCIE